MEAYYSKDEAQQIANDNNLGNITWVEKIALNTGKLFEVGYVYSNSTRELFCKLSKGEGFYLCNQFRELDQ